MSDKTPPPVLLAKKWMTDTDPTGYWMSEKLDGVRAWWDGTRFVSRLGNVYHAPAWFTRELPSYPLDGELWVGRGEFQRCVSIVRRRDAGLEWGQVTYLVFDAPEMAGTFEQRQVGLNFWRASLRDSAHVEIVAQDLCLGADHLQAELARVEDLGGEGLMLRAAGSRYEVGRSASLLKVKSFSDAEATVIGHTAGRGRNASRTGALLCEAADGTRFSVGTGLSDADRDCPPAIGSIITYRYQELTDDGVPRFPSYVGTAIDKVLA